MLDITEILKHAPAGTALYSPIFGNIEFVEVIAPTERSNFEIKTKFGNRFVYFTKDGRYSDGVGECLLFPSETIRSWEGISYEPPREDLPQYTPVVTFTWKPKSSQELVVLYYDKNGNCFLNGKTGPVLAVPHAVPIDKFDFNNLTWDSNDDYGTQVSPKEEPINFYELLKKFYK